MKLRNWLAVLILIIVFLLQPVWSQTATILNEGFESGNLNGWQTSGFLFVSSLRPHTGNFSVMLGSDESLLRVSYSHDPSLAAHKGAFMLSRSLDVAPQSNLTVKFWYSSWNPWSTEVSEAVMQFRDIVLRCSLQEGNVIAASQSFDYQDFLNSSGGSTPWRQVTVRLTVPSDAHAITLNFTGRGGWASTPGVGIILIDDIEASLLPQSAVPELTTTPIVAFIVLIISFSVLNYYKKLRRTKLIRK